MSTKTTSNIRRPVISGSDDIIHLSDVCLEGLKLSMGRLMNADDYIPYQIGGLVYISGLIVMMQDHIANNHEIIEREGTMSAEFPTSREQQAQAKLVTEELRVELDAARLLNLDVIPVSYETLDNLSQLLIGLRQRIQNQDTEIKQLRDRMSGLKGNQPQEPVYHASKRNLFI